MTDPHIILPAGTQIVTRVSLAGASAERPHGAVGMVVRAPRDHRHRYRVRFPDGEEASLRRAEFAVRRQVLREGLETALDPMAEHDLYDYVIYRCVVGSRAYGLDEPGSDTDLRGVHLLPARDVLGLRTPRETIEVSKREDGLEFDLVTHDAAKFFRLLLKRNGYVLEQLLSPLVVHTTEAHERLKALAPGCITRHHAHHYVGFAKTQWKLFEKENPPRVKPLLYLYRVLLTGIHLMQTGEVEANLVRLNERFRLPWIAELIARKVEGQERERLDAADLSFHRQQYERLVRDLEAAGEQSRLPDMPSTRDALSDLLVELRLGTLGGRTS